MGSDEKSKIDGASTRTAIVIPVLNEAPTVGKVASDFHEALPQASIYIIDNGSTDGTIGIVRNIPYALIDFCPKRGKGAVVRHALNSIDADFYLFVDGDDTYPAENAEEMLLLAQRGFDMVIGDRLSNGTYFKENRKAINSFGNMLVRKLMSMRFGDRGEIDVMSGYRVLSRDFAENFNPIHDGFQVETEMCMKALKDGYSIASVPITYRDRPEGSESKLSSVLDGIKVIACFLGDSLRGR